MVVGYVDEETMASHWRTDLLDWKLRNALSSEKLSTKKSAKLPESKASKLCLEGLDKSPCMVLLIIYVKMKNTFFTHD